jgi:uncharacterized RmlC-like cupin family protein
VAWAKIKQEATSEQRKARISERATSPCYQATSISGHAKMRWGDRMQFEEDVEPGDFIYVPPFAPHQEINPSPDTCAGYLRSSVLK